jgi:hypothetical protein
MQMNLSLHEVLTQFYQRHSIWAIGCLSIWYVVRCTQLIRARRFHSKVVYLISPVSFLASQYLLVESHRMIERIEVSNECFLAGVIVYWASYGFMMSYFDLPNDRSNDELTRRRIIWWLKYTFAYYMFICLAINPNQWVTVGILWGLVIPFVFWYGIKIETKNRMPLVSEVK